MPTSRRHFLSGGAVLAVAGTVLRPAHIAALSMSGSSRALVGALASVAGGVSTAVMAETDVQIKLRELYNKDGSFSELATSLLDERVSIEGYMAPPLKANSSFFVLTKRPMTTCPFCSDAAEWPRDILAVYTKRTLQVVPFNVDIVVSGRLELGDHTDPSTGFVSRVRLQDARVQRG